MQTYTVTYNDGDTETIKAARLDLGSDTSRTYIGYDDQNRLVWFAHHHTVRSVRLALEA